MYYISEITHLHYRKLQHTKLFSVLHMMFIMYCVFSVQARNKFHYNNTSVAMTPVISNERRRDKFSFWKKDVI